jgi:hypothetical protein
MLSFNCPLEPHSKCLFAGPISVRLSPSRQSFPYGV